jgi:hypothetical protein
VDSKNIAVFGEKRDAQRASAGYRLLQKGIGWP